MAFNYKKHTLFIIIYYITDNGYKLQILAIPTGPHQPTTYIQHRCDLNAIHFRHEIIMCGVHYYTLHNNE